MHKIPNNALIVVADGNGARLFRNVGENNAIKLTQDKVIEPIEMNGPSGSAPEGMSIKQLDEATFAKQLADWLNEKALKNAYSHLVLIADPSTLGHIRPQLHKETEQRLVGEIGKTFTNSPIEHIERALQSQ